MSIVPSIFGVHIVSMNTNVIYAIGPSVNGLPNYFFPSKTIFKILTEFIMTKLVQIQYLLHLRSTNF
jgi:hypothetical protein